MDKRLYERAKHDLGYLRTKRARLFKAFDIYKENVNYGLISEDEQTHERLATWYHKCLELDFEAIDNCPSELEKYLW